MDHIMPAYFTSRDPGWSWLTALCLQTDGNRLRGVRGRQTEREEREKKGNVERGKKESQSVLINSHIERGRIDSALFRLTLRPSVHTGPMHVLTLTHQIHAMLTIQRGVLIYSRPFLKYPVHSMVYQSIISFTSAKQVEKQMHFEWRQCILHTNDIYRRSGSTGEN